MDRNRCPQEHEQAALICDRPWQWLLNMGTQVTIGKPGQLWTSWRKQKKQNCGRGDNIVAVFFSQELWFILDGQKKNRIASSTEDLFKKRMLKQAAFPQHWPQPPWHESHAFHSLLKQTRNPPTRVTQQKVKRFHLNHSAYSFFSPSNFNYLSFHYN